MSATYSISKASTIATPFSSLSMLQVRLLNVVCTTENDATEMRLNNNKNHQNEIEH